MNKYLILDSVGSKSRVLLILIFFALASYLTPHSANAARPTDYGLKEGDTISATGSSDPDIYIVNDAGYKRLFLNPVIFGFYGHLGGFTNVKAVSATTRDAFPTSGLFRNCETNDEKVYGVESTGEDTGTLHWVNTTGAQATIDDPNFFQKVFCINNNEFNWYSKGSNYNSVNQIPVYSRNTTSTPPPISSTFQLQSNFLKNDSTAQAIASGALPNYDIRTTSYVYGGAGPSSTDNFSYRFLSAIRMLGYVKGSQSIGGQNMNEQILNRVERFNNLSVSPYIDKSVLKIIDSILVGRERLDSSLASNFPLSSHFIGAPLNEPTKDHVAAVFSGVLGELPSSLVFWSEQNFKDYFRNQLSGRFNNIDTQNYQICDIAIYSELGDGCTAVVYSGTPLVNKIPSIITDDFDNGTTIVHEYAHHLDKNIYPRNSATSQGLIDTTSFYAISFNLSDPGSALSTGKTYSYKNPSNIKNDFVSAYAHGWQAGSTQYFTAAEDFAESFAMYVSEGKVFRKLAENNSVLQQKYDWLKQNVFQGQEYQSGDVAGIAAIKQQPTSTDITTGAFNTRDYSQSLPNFVWNYKFLNGSLVPKP